MRRRLLIHGLFGCMLLLAGPGRAEEYKMPSAGIVSMTYADDRFSMETRDAPLARVLEEMSRMAGMRIIADGPVEGKVTVYMTALPTDKAAKKVLRGKDLSLLYEPANANTPGKGYRLAEIRIYVSEGDFSSSNTHSYTKKTKKSQPAPVDRTQPRRSRPPPPPPPPASTARPRFEPPPDIEDLDPEEVLSALIGGDQEALDQLAETLKDQDPEVQEQISQFLDALEEAQVQAAEAGEDLEPTEGLGAMGAIMHHMMRQRRE